MKDDRPSVETHTLAPSSELRVEIPHLPPTSHQSGRGLCTVRLLSGSAELFGSELATDHPYGFTGSKIAIFSWHGCTIELSGKYDVCYTSDETNSNVSYVNTHAQLEVLRDDSLKSLSEKEESKEEKKKEGPRVLICGPPDSGKSSLCRTLLSYATKLHRSPIYVDLDVSSQTLSVPGTIAATPVSCGGVNPSSPTGISAGGDEITPLTLWYGDVDVSSSPDLYKSLVAYLGRCVDARMNRDVDAKSSGIIVNTPGSMNEGGDVGYQLLLNAIEVLRISVVLIMGHDRLYAQLKNACPNIKVIKLPRSGGVVSRDVAFRRSNRATAIRRYFHGDVIKSGDNFVNQYTSSAIEIPLSQVTLYKLVTVDLAASMLPVGQLQSTDPVQIQQIDDFSEGVLHHQVCAVCHPDAVEKYNSNNEHAGEDKKARDLYLNGVAGFVKVEKVDLEKGILRFLSPCGGELPSKTLLMGDITWME